MDTQEEYLSVWPHAQCCRQGGLGAPGHKMEKYLDDFKVSRFRCN